MIHYLLRFPLWFLVIIARYPLAFLAVAWRDGLKLSPLFWWLDTCDNDLTGDAGWKAEHCYGLPYDCYMNMVRWIWRNGGNNFNYWIIGVPADTRPAWAFWSKKAIPLFAGRFLDLRFGWSDYQLLGRCKYVFTIRIKTKP